MHTLNHSNAGLCVGVVGYSGRKFNIDQAILLMQMAFAAMQKLYPKRELVIVSGLTNIGIPKIAYEQAVQRGWRTVGVACSRAKNSFPVDEKIIVGHEWGDESEAFLGLLDCMIRIGGGPQTLAEAEQFKATGGMVLEYELEFIPNQYW